MKTIYIHMDQRMGRIVVEHDRSLSSIEVFSALADASRTVYQSILDEDVRKRKLESGKIEEVMRLIVKQKNPKLN